MAIRTRFSEWVRRHNWEPSGQALHLRTLAATPAVAAALEVEAGGIVVAYERLGLADGVPVVLTTHMFPALRLPGLLDGLRLHPTITAALQAAGVADHVRRSTCVSSRMPTAEEAGLLQAPRRHPVLVCENVNVDAAGMVVEFGIARYPSTRVQVVFEP